MRIQIFFTLSVFALIAFTKAQDVSNLLKDKRLVTRQIDCVLDRGRCNTIGRKIKALLPEALNNNCRRCTPREAAHAQKLIGFMRQNYPREWHLIQRHYAKPQY